MKPTQNNTAGTEQKKIKLISRKGFRDYEITGIGDIYRAAVPYGIKIGHFFNIYRGESTKNGCKWMGNLHYSLLNHIQP